VVAALPVVLTGTVSIEGKTGRVENVLTREAYRSQALVTSVYGASGVDAQGPWNMDGGAGLVERLTASEGLDPVFDAWVLRREYVAAFDAARDRVDCVDAPSGARLDITYVRPDLGAPRLAFDLTSAALTALEHRQADGKPLVTTIEAWGPLDRGVRWPRRVTDHPVAGSTPTSTFEATSHELTCVRWEADVAIPDRGDACAAPPADRFTRTWPEGGVVRVPMTFHGSELFVRAKVGTRELWALLDSGASITSIDATAPIAAAFTSRLDLSGSGATQKVRFGIGELAAIELGGLRAEHVPTASVPIPALDAFGEKRPELILGYPFFVGAAVRVDYARGVVAFAREPEALFAKGAPLREVPMHALKSKLVATGAVEGMPALFEVDTGNAGGLNLFKKWASAHDLPGSRPSLSLRGRFGVGEGATTSVFFRAKTAALGPIAFDDRLTHVSDPPETGDIAGLAGNEVLSRCDAVVFDHGRRKLWLEGSCERATPERRVGWRFERRPEAAYENRPWLVGAVLPGSAAERAGIRVGDRVLEVDGRPATLAVEAIWAAESKPEGTKLPVVVARNGKRERLVVELRSLLR